MVELFWEGGDKSFCFFIETKQQPWANKQKYGSFANCSSVVY